jgi:hypothetical protein
MFSERSLDYCIEKRLEVWNRAWILVRTIESSGALVLLNCICV